LPLGDPRLFDPARWSLPDSGPAGAVPPNRANPVSEVPRAVVTPSVMEPAVVTSSATNVPVAEHAQTEPDNPQAHPSSSSGSANDSPKMTPVRAVRLIGLAEDIYAQKHPGTGFTCFLSELINVGRGFDDGEPYKFMDPEFAQGVYNGYRFSLAGCGGSPVKSFQVTAEPASGAGRAYCSDATHVLRGSDDGNGASCLVSGKIVQR
jgi:hypothetical protein